MEDYYLIKMPTHFGVHRELIPTFIMSNTLTFYCEGGREGGSSDIVKDQVLHIRLVIYLFTPTQPLILLLLAEN